METIFPVLRYRDARGAIRSLCESFGFVELFSVPESGPFVDSRECHVRDCEGHPWTFGTYRPDVDRGGA